jgi:hypothetical protein
MEVHEAFRKNPYYGLFTRWGMYMQKCSCSCILVHAILGLMWPIILTIALVADCCILRRGKPAEMEWIADSVSKVSHLDGIAVESEMATQLQALAENISRKYPSLRVVYWNGIQHYVGAGSNPDYDQDEFLLLFYPQAASQALYSHSQV